MDTATFTYLPFDRYLGCFEILSITNKNFKDIHIKVIVWTQFSSFSWLNENGLSGLYSRCMFFKLCYIFHFMSSDYLKISLKMSLIHGLFRNLLCNFQIFVSFPDTLIMISSLISLCCTIAILINLLVFVLWHGIWSILWIFPVHLRRMFVLLLLDEWSINVN